MLGSKYTYRWERPSWLSTHQLPTWLVMTVTTIFVAAAMIIGMNTSTPRTYDDWATEVCAARGGVDDFIVSTVAVTAVCRDHTPHQLTVD